MVGRALGHHVRVVIPENVFPEIPRTLEAYGAEIQWVPGELGVKRAIEVARQIAADEGWYMLDQFADATNVRSHYEGTAAEILADLPQVDMFVAGPRDRRHADGRRSPAEGGESRDQGDRHRAASGQPGAGLKSLADGFIPPLLDYSVLDGKILVRSGHAFRAAAELMRREAIFGGVSSGAVLHGALKAIQRLQRGNVVLLFADSGWKYITTEMWTSAPDVHDDEDLDEVIWW